MTDSKKGAAVGLPMEKRGPSLATQRDELSVQIDEVESSLRFMGAAHPKRVELEEQLERLRTLLASVEAALRK